MTTGSTSVLEDLGRLGSYTLNRRTNKSWSGADQPPLPPREPRLSRTKKYGRLKKRSKRKYAEHAYSKTVDVYNTGIAYGQQLLGDVWTKVVYNSTAANVSALKSQVVFDAAQEYRLIDALRRQIYGSGFNAGIFAAEMPKALRMIADAAVRIGAGIHQLRSGDWHGCLTTFGITPYGARYFRPGTRDLSKLWLEIQYGWKPLLGDLHNGAEYVAHAIHGRVPGSVRASRKWKQTIAATYGSNPNTVVLDRAVVSNELSIIIKAVNASPQGMPNIADVASVAWEILPYSFVSDWVVPIGGYLQALRTSQAVTGTVIRSHKRIIIATDPRSGSPSTYKLGGIVGDFSWTEVVFSRSISTVLEVPQPIDGSGLEVFTNWQRAANAVSLLGVQNWSGLYEKFKNLSRR